MLPKNEKNAHKKKEEKTIEMKPAILVMSQQT